MATWEDGPEYAPVERPAEFTRPAVAPLSVAPPAEQMAALAPKERPAFDDPSAPVAPLETLLPDVEETRDPQLPFAVVSSTMTSDSAWGALHWGPPSGATSRPAPGCHAAADCPAPGRHAAADRPLWAPRHRRPARAERAAGDPQRATGVRLERVSGAWHAGLVRAPGVRGTADAAGRDRRQGGLDAATPGLCICLPIGGLVYVARPGAAASSLGLTGG